MNHGIQVVIIPELCSGCPKCVAACPVDCMSVPEFWAIRSKDDTFTGRCVIIIGSGETAASITRCIVERSIPSDLVIVSPTETIYSRGE